MLKDTFKPNLPFWLLTVAILIGLTVPVLIKDGMFMDAMLYSSVSHNLSLGIGTFWFPQFSFRNLGEMSSFHEQPPLVFGIQAIFFKILGGSLYTERIYTLTTMCITAMLIHLFWKEIHTNESLKKQSWLPIILWITIPTIYWSYSNNMQENTMGVFTLGSGLFAFKALRSMQFNPKYFILAGVLVFLATLSKGIPGFFTISMPFLYWISTQKISFKRAIKGTAIMLLIPLVFYGILLLYPVSRESLSIYFFSRLVGRVAYEHSARSRFQTLWDILSNLIPQFCFVVVVLVASGIKKVKILILENGSASLIIFFILTALSGSASLILTMVQSGFYVVPACPFYAIGLSLCVAPVLSRPLSLIKINNKGYKIFLASTCILLLAVIVFSFSQVGKIRRDKDVLHDVYIIGKVVPAFSVVAIDPADWNEWELQCYLIRYFNISIDPKENHQYFLASKDKNVIIQAGYHKLNLGLDKYDIYQKQ